MNLVEITAQVACAEDQAKALMGRVSHVEYTPETGLARLRLSAQFDGTPLPAVRSALDRIEESLREAGIDPTLALEFTVSSEALIPEDGHWRRRGEIVPSTLPLLS